MAAGRICLGMIVGVHGVRGHLKIKAYTGNPAALDRYGPLSLDDGRLLHLKVKSVSAKGPVIAMAQEVTDRDEAELMRGLELFISRDALPPVANDEVYHTDLIGLDARGMDGEAIGVIVGLHDFGAGDIIEVKPPSGRTMMLPFAPEYRDEVKPEAGFVTLSPPPGMIELAGPEGNKETLDRRLDREKRKMLETRAHRRS